MACRGWGNGKAGVHLVAAEKDFQDPVIIYVLSFGGPKLTPDGHKGPSKTQTLERQGQPRSAGQ